MALGRMVVSVVVAVEVDDDAHGPGLFHLQNAEADTGSAVISPLVARVCLCTGTPGTALLPLPDTAATWRHR